MNLKYKYAVMLPFVLFVFCAVSLNAESNPQPHTKQVALSFDDAPLGDGAFLRAEQRTDMLIKKLTDLNIPPVVFFCVSSRLKNNHGSDRITKYAGAGHLIANHTHSHKHTHDLGAVGYLEDIATAHNLLNGFDNFRQWFRYPFLDRGNTMPLQDSIRKGLDSLGYKIGYVTIDTWDWYLDSECREAAQAGIEIDTSKLRDIYLDMIYTSAEFYDSLSVEILGRSPKHILLLHENDLTALYIDDLVARFRANGWEIISPDDAFTDPLADLKPDVIPYNQGKIGALAVERNNGSGFRSYSEDKKYLDSLFAAQNLFKDK